jgi:hypothetical protein
VAMATATWCTDIPVSSSTAMLTYMSVLNPLLRTTAQTHVLEFNTVFFICKVGFNILVFMHYHVSIYMIDGYK